MANFHQDLSLYAPALRQMYLDGAHNGMTMHQFVQVYKRRNPHMAHRLYQPFYVPMWTRPDFERARQIRVDPNSRNFFEKFLWDIRQAWDQTWDKVKHRVDILVHGQPLDASRAAVVLRSAKPYAVHVVPHPDGAFVLPAAAPVDEELSQRRERDAQRRVKYEAKTAEAAAPVMRVRDAIGAKFADAMTELSKSANVGSSGDFRIVGTGSASRVAAIKAVRDPEVYKELGYSGVDDFFRRHLNTDRPTDAVNSLSYEMDQQMRKMPSKTQRFDPEGLHKLYHTTAISGPLLTQWANTVRGWFGNAPVNRATTGTYRVRSDFGLQVRDGSGPVTSAPFHWQKQPQRATPSQADDSPFAPFAFQARTERTENHLRRQANDAEMVRRFFCGDNAPVRIASVQAPVASMPTVHVPGASLVDGPPPAEPLSYVTSSSVPPPAEPLSSVFDSMPDAISIDQAAFGSMPDAIPLNSVDQAAFGSMPDATPLNSVDQAAFGSMPDAIPLNSADQAAVDSMPDAVSLQSQPPPAEPLSSVVADQAFFASMPDVGSLQRKSANSDPLAAELARDVIASTDYSGVVVPDYTVMPEAVRAGAAAAIRSAPDRAARVKPYLFKRMNTSSTMNALLSPQAENQQPVLAANMRSWLMSSDGKGGFSMHAKDGKTHAVAVHRMHERPEAVMIYAPLSHTAGQH